ncbi:MAG: DUF488 family protein [Thermodesulfobacteriota bacterium]
MKIKLKRVYDVPEESDGVRVLVERLWPRGLSKEKAKVDIWLKEAAPSTDLRKWFNHDKDKWEEFKQRYYSELDNNRLSLEPIFEISSDKNITFVFASKENRFNNAAALRDYLT